MTPLPWMSEQAPLLMEVLQVFWGSLLSWPDVASCLDCRSVGRVAHSGKLAGPDRSKRAASVLSCAIASG